jgi:hypothetical protein
VTGRPVRTRAATGPACTKPAIRTTYTRVSKKLYARPSPIARTRVAPKHSRQPRIACIGAGCTVPPKIQLSPVISCQIPLHSSSEGSRSRFLARHQDPPTLARNKHPAKVRITARHKHPPTLNIIGQKIEFQILMLVVSIFHLNIS